MIATVEYMILNLCGSIHREQDISAKRTMSIPTFMPTITVTSFRPAEVSGETKEVKIDQPIPTKDGDAVNAVDAVNEMKMYDNMRTFREEYKRRQLILDEQAKKKSEVIKKKNLLSKDFRKQIFAELKSGEKKCMSVEEMKKISAELDKATVLTPTIPTVGESTSSTSSTEMGEKKLSSRLRRHGRGSSIYDGNSELNPSKKMSGLINLCVDRLTELGVQVAWMGYNLDGFGQEEWFSENFDLLIFICVKGNWVFEGHFTESHDCAPGIFKLVEVENLGAVDATVAEERRMLKRIYCDMFCRNTSEDALARVMELFAEPNVQTLIKKKFGPILSFADDLKSYLTTKHLDGEIVVTSKEVKIYPFEYTGDSFGELVDLTFAGFTSAINGPVKIYCVYKGKEILLSAKNYMDRMDISTDVNNFGVGGLYNYFPSPSQLPSCHLLHDPTPIYSLNYTGPSDLPKFWTEVMGMFNFAKGTYGFPPSRAIAFPLSPYPQISSSSSHLAVAGGGLIRGGDTPPAGGCGSDMSPPMDDYAYKNSDVARVLTELPKSSNCSNFKKEWWFAPVKPHEGKMIDTCIELTFDPSNYTIHPVIIRLRIFYDLAVDEKNCILTVETLSKHHKEEIPWHNDSRPEELKAANPLIEFNDNFSYRGSFQFVVDHMKRIFLNLFRLHLSGQMYEGYDSVFDGLRGADKPYIV